ncbi:MAG: SDR family NAD(P)-dependent oxidoreductase, partial [Deltaproteobacteria bacterium]|nr:SDR family NAD(P)-dependent oxidoreductase [Deltaproteobacteria bacterium]
IGRWLLFLEPGALHEGLVGGMRERGHEVMVVHRGPSFRAVDRETCEASPEDPQAVSMLFTALDEDGGAPVAGVVFGWDGDGGDLGCGTVVEIVRELAAGRAAAGARLWLLGALAPGLEVTGAGQSAFTGLGACLGWEHPECWGGCVLIGPQPGAPEVAALCAELEQPDGEGQVLLRGGVRRVARLVRRPSDGLRPFRPRGDGASYLITGGLGGIGVAVAEYLAAAGARHLVLVGRSAPGESARAAIARLREGGCEVEAARADVRSRAELEELFAGIEGGGREVKGVFHAAGVVADGTIRNLTRER